MRSGVSHSPDVFGDEFYSSKADGLIPILAPVGFIPALEGDDRRCYHDAIVATVSLITQVQTFLDPSLQGEDLLNLRIPFEFSQELIEAVRK